MSDELSTVAVIFAGWAMSCLVSVVWAANPPIQLRRCLALAESGASLLFCCVWLRAAAGRFVLA